MQILICERAFSFCIIADRLTTEKKEIEKSLADIESKIENYFNG